MANETAILIDRQNVGESFREIIETLRRSGKVGEIVLARAYACWAKQSSGIQNEAAAWGIKCVPVNPGKNVADLELALDAVEIASHLPIEVFALVTGDGGFIFRTLIARLHSYKRTVIVCANENCTRSTLKSICDAYVPIPSRAQNSITKALDDELSKTESEAETIKPTEHMCKLEVTQDSNQVLALLKSKREFADIMTHCGLALSSLAGPLRPLRGSGTPTRRWLLKLVVSATKSTDFCVAKSEFTGDHRLFLRHKVPEGYMIV